MRIQLPVIYIGWKLTNFTIILERRPQKSIRSAHKICVFSVFDRRAIRFPLNKRFVSFTYATVVRIVGLCLSFSNSCRFIYIVIIIIIVLYNTKISTYTHIHTETRCHTEHNFANSKFIILVDGRLPSKKHTFDPKIIRVRKNENIRLSRQNREKKYLTLTQQITNTHQFFLPFILCSKLSKWKVFFFPLSDKSNRLARGWHQQQNLSTIFTRNELIFSTIPTTKEKTTRIKLIILFYNWCGHLMSAESNLKIQSNFYSNCFA